jgi:hypothetical protein
LCIEKKMAVDINIVIYNGDFVEKVWDDFHLSCERNFSSWAECMCNWAVLFGINLQLCRYKLE